MVYFLNVTYRFSIPDTEIALCTLTVVPLLGIKLFYKVTLQQCSGQHSIVRQRAHMSYIVKQLDSILSNLTTLS